eukprot:1327753-Prymnesium_polylepis.1
MAGVALYEDLLILVLLVACAATFDRHQRAIRLALARRLVEHVETRREVDRHEAVGGGDLKAEADKLDAVLAVDDLDRV